MGPVMVAEALAISDEGVVGVDENDIGFQSVFIILRWKIV
jgi:hypothetical protein